MAQDISNAIGYVLITDILYCKSLCSGQELISAEWPDRMLPEPDVSELAAGYSPTISSEFKIILNVQTILTANELIYCSMVPNILLCTYFDFVFSNRLIKDCWKNQLEEQLGMIKRMVLFLRSDQEYAFTKCNLIKEKYKKSLDKLISILRCSSEI